MTGAEVDSFKIPVAPPGGTEKFPAVRQKDFGRGSFVGAQFAAPGAAVDGAAQGVVHAIGGVTVRGTLFGFVHSAFAGFYQRIFVGGVDGGAVEQIIVLIVFATSASGFRYAEISSTLPIS